MTFLLSVLIVLLGSYNYWLILNIRKINQDLEFIHQEETVKELTFGTNHKELLKLYHRCNDLVRDNKNLIALMNDNEKMMYATVSNVIHDLRTPLTVASGYIQLVLENSEREDDSERLHYAKDRLQEVSINLESLYQLSRIEEKDKYVMTTMNFSSLLKETIVQYYDSFERGNVHLEMQITDKLHIKADRSAMKRMISNLVSNMLEYSLSKAWIHARCDDNIMVVVFMNTIESQTLDVTHAFQRYVTCHQRGTGLGLYIVKQIVLAHGGEVSIVAQDFVFSLEIKIPLNDE